METSFAKVSLFPFDISSAQFLRRFLIGPLPVRFPSSTKAIKFYYLLLIIAFVIFCGNLNHLTSVNFSFLFPCFTYQNRGLRHQAPAESFNLSFGFSVERETVLILIYLFYFIYRFPSQLGGRLYILEQEWSRLFCFSYLFFI